MKNKLKIAAIVIALVAGMVLYKDHFEKKAKKDKAEKKPAEVDSDLN